MGLSLTTSDSGGSGMGQSSYQLEDIAAALGLSETDSTGGGRGTSEVHTLAPTNPAGRLSLTTSDGGGDGLSTNNTAETHNIAPTTTVFVRVFDTDPNYGRVVQVTNQADLEALLSRGGRPFTYGDNGEEVGLGVAQVAGQWLLYDGAKGGWIPTNVEFGGTMTQAQQRFIQDANTVDPTTGLSPVMVASGNFQNTPPSTNGTLTFPGGGGTQGGTTPPQGGGSPTSGNTTSYPAITTSNSTPTLPTKAQDLLRVLAQLGVNRQSGLDQAFNNTGDFINELRGDAQNSITKRDSYVGNLLNGADGKTGILPGLQDIIGRSNTAEGLSPEAMSALRTQSTSGLNRQFDQAAGTMKTDLLRRGAYGGEMPASAGDNIRAFAPLYQGLEEAKSNANTSTIMANEAQKISSLNQNRAAGQNALGTLGQLMGQLGDIYNPAPFNSAANAASSNLTSMFTAPSAYLNNSTTAANSLANLEPASFRSILLSSILGNAGGIAGAITGTQPSGGSGLGGGIQAIVQALSGLFGGGGGNDTQNGGSGTWPEEFNNLFGF